MTIRAVTGGALPSVLVVSHNPFSDVQNNGKTLAGFFEGWPKDRLAQLYLTLDEPSFTHCENFFRITDLDVLKAAVGRSQDSGVVREQDWTRDSAEKSSLLQNPFYRAVRRIFIARPPSALLARSLFWARVERDLSALDAWLDRIDPDVVFFQSSSASFAFDLVEDICARRGAALVMQTTDDYVTPRHGWLPTSRAYYRGMQRVYRRAVRRSETVVAICDKMAGEYRRRFDGRYLVAMNTVDADELGTLPPEPPRTGPVILRYAGNLGLNRWRVLSGIGRALADLHAGTGLDARLEIYSLNDLTARELGSLTIPGRSEFKGALDSETLRQRQEDADILVHVESFDAKNRHVTRLSVSTKIPEYMAAGRPIFAVGPGDVASIEYLSDHQAALVVSSARPDAIGAGLASLLSDAPLRNRLRENAWRLVKQNHSKKRTRASIARLVTEAAERV